jgi:hypothetical protein
VPLTLTVKSSTPVAISVMSSSAVVPLITSVPVPSLSTVEASISSKLTG